MKYTVKVNKVRKNKERKFKGICNSGIWRVI